MGVPSWRKDKTPQSTLAEIVDMEGETISLLKFEGKRRSGKTYSVEAFVVKDGSKNFGRSGTYYGNIHRLDGRPSTRNCHEFKGTDLLEVMLKSIDDAAEYCLTVSSPSYRDRPHQWDGVHQETWTYGSPSVETRVNRVRDERLAKRLEFERTGKPW